MDEITEQKYNRLKEYIKSLESVAIAFSGGVDSTLLLFAAKEVLGQKAVAITARSCSFPERELNAAKAFCAANDIKHIIFKSEELLVEGFAQNPKNRCYLCKKELFSRLSEIAKSEKLAYVAEGSNTDDEGDYRPGRIAVAELNIKSPLLEAGLCKKEIREISKHLNLPTWNKQSFACLASRFPYGELITAEALSAIDKAEQLLLDMGFCQVRVRRHANIARIELDNEGFALLTNEAKRTYIYENMKKLGFTYVSLDLSGYRTESMNEIL
ncbi:MAG: ATP-dependent sacrificial sulfur transferase LarE [Clostridiales bacterium]|nr:ATP-dependent sacrificial sulfur transferase LarE [Clostridiales bacterium]